MDCDNVIVRIAQHFGVRRLDAAFPQPGLTGRCTPNISAVLLSGLLLSPSVRAADTPDPSSHIDATTYQRVVDENLGLRKDQARFEAETGDLRRKNASLLLDLQDLERKRDQLTAIISQLKTPEETKAEISRLRTEKQVLLREIERLRQALTTANQYSTSNIAIPAPATGSDLFRKIEKENADLRQELAKAKESTVTASAGKEALSKNESALKVEVSRLTGQCKKAAVELDVFKRREAAMKKALEDQARKAFEADKELKLVKSQLAAKVSRQDGPHQPNSPGSAKGGTAASPSVVPLKVGQELPDLLATARILLAAKRTKEAEALYLKAFGLEPRNPQVNYNLGVLYGDYLKDPRKASKYYRRYIELAPRAPDVAAVRAWILDLDARSR